MLLDTLKGVKFVEFRRKHEFDRIKMDRSEMMRSVKRENTLPELVVRQTLHSMGYRFRLHRKDLPGSPDIVLPKHRTVIFVNGCFWHHHNDCPRASIPRTNTDYWMKKFESNKARDARNVSGLRTLGWKVLIFWGCEVKNHDLLVERLKHALPTNEHQKDSRFVKNSIPV